MKTKKILILTLIMSFLMTTFSNIAFAATPEKTFTGYIDVSDKSQRYFSGAGTYAVPFYSDNELTSKNGKYSMKIYQWGTLIVQDNESKEIIWSKGNSLSGLGLVLFHKYGLTGLTYSQYLEPRDYYWNFTTWEILPYSVRGKYINYLYLQNDGNLVMYNNDLKAVWMTKKYTKNTKFSSTKQMNTTAYIDAFGTVYSSTTMWASGISGFKGKIKLEVLDSNNAVIGSKTFGAYGVSGFSKRNVDCNFSIDASKAGQEASIRITHYK